MRLKILYPVIDGEITGGNIIALRIIEESLKKGYAAVVNSPTEGKFTSLLRNKGIKVYCIDTRRTFRLDSAFKLAGIIKNEGINLIHSHAPLAGAVSSRLAGWIAAIPVINHAHTPYYMNINPIVRCYQFLLNWLTGRLCCFKVIAVSEFVNREVIRQGIPRHKVITIYNGIDSARVGYNNSQSKIREEFGLGNNQFIVGHVGRLANDKGQHVLIEAAGSVIKNYPNVVFMITGEDLNPGQEYKNKLEKLIKDSGLNKQFIFTGYRSDIMDFMYAFDVFVLPSTYLEGLPVVILEAMAAGKPVIATAVGGTPEIVLDGQTGTLIAPNDPEKLAEAILFHINNPEISKQMGEKGYQRVKDRFPETLMLDKIMDLYKEVIKR